MNDPTSTEQEAIEDSYPSHIEWNNIFEIDRPCGERERECGRRDPS